jgi:hypothetical protein
VFNQNLEDIMLKKFFVAAIIVLSTFSAAFGNIMFSDKKYQNKIETRSFLLDKDKVCSMFAANKAEQLPYSRLKSEHLYLAVRIKNIGNKAAWGELSCKIDGRVITSLAVPILPANMDEYYNFVIPIGGVILSKMTDYPQISTKWIKIKSK